MVGYFIVHSNTSTAAVSITAPLLSGGALLYASPASADTSLPKHSFSSLPVLHCPNYFALYY